jgi:vacuolar-type H+-ATPase subunit H
LEEIIENLIEGEEGASTVAKEKGKKVISDAKDKAEKLLKDVDNLIGQIKGEGN